MLANAAALFGSFSNARSGLVNALTLEEKYSCHCVNHMGNVRDDCSAMQPKDKMSPFKPTA